MSLVWSVVFLIITIFLGILYLIRKKNYFMYGSGLSLIIAVWLLIYFVLSR